MTADLEAELRSYGIDVEAVTPGDSVELAYTTAFPGDEIHRREIGRALNTFIDLARYDEWEPVRVDATVLTAPDDELGSWTAHANWFEALLEESMTETEFSTRVLETVEHTP